MKKARGFTLIELVVIIAIIGVLAAILVPTMLNYIRKAKLKAANTNAKTAYHGVVEYFTEKNAVDGMSEDDILNQYGSTPIDCNVPPQSSMSVAQIRMHDLLAQNGINSGHVWVGKDTINGIDAIYVQWTNEVNAGTVPDAIIGQYPDPITWETYKSPAYKNPSNAWERYVAPV